MTIREDILEFTIKSREARIQKLEEIGSPAIILKLEKEQLAELKSGIIKINGDVKALDEPMIDAVAKKGRGGVPYISYNGGAINYFPNAKYGRYIAFSK